MVTFAVEGVVRDRDGAAPPRSARTRRDHHHPADRRHRRARARLDRPGVRVRLQPRAVGPRGLGRGRPAHARGRREPRRDQRLRLVARRAAPGRVRLRRPRPRHRPAARRRDRRRPRHRDGLDPAVAHHRPPRGPAGRGRRHDPLARRTPGVLPELPGLPRARPRPRPRHRRALRRPPRGPALARLERARLPQRALLLRRLRRGLPRLAPEPVRHRRGAERRLGHVLLEPALLRVGPGPAAAGDAVLHEPRPDARLRPVLVRRTARAPPRRGRGPARPERQARHDELHGRGAHHGARLLVVGRGHGRHRERPLPRPPTAPTARRARVRRGHHPRARRRSALAAHGALDGRRELAAVQRREGAGEMLRNTVAHIARGPTASASSSGARRCRAARSSTPHSCRTRAPTPAPGATSWTSAPSSSGSASSAGPASSPTWRSSSAGRTSGRRPGGAPQHRAPLPRAGPRVPRRAVGPRRDRRRRGTRRVPRRLRRRPRAGAVHGA